MMMITRMETWKFFCFYLLFGQVSADFKTGSPAKEVIHLDGTSFHEAIKDPANPFWFLKFYAPWCGHCKRMAPVLDKVATSLEGKMAIGKIDCTVHKSLCSEFKVRGYPTLKYSIDGEILDYPGGRDEAAITSFAKKLSGPPVHVVQTYDEAFAYAKDETAEGVAFLGFDPRSTAEDPTPFHQVFSQVARQKQASAYFVWMVPGSDERSYQFVHKIEAGIQPKSYEDHDRDITAITKETFGAWVDANNVPLVVELGPNNFNRIGKAGRHLALSVVDFSNTEQKKVIKDHMLSFASTLNSKDAEKYYFGIMDGGKWSKFLTQFSVEEADNPQMLVLDIPTKTYWQNNTYKNMVEFMKAVQDGEIESRVATKATKNGLLGKIESLFLDNMPYSLIVLLLLVFGIVFLLVPSADDLRPPYDSVQDGGEVIGEDKDGVVNSAVEENKKQK